MPVLRIDGSIAHRARGQEYVLVLGSNLETHPEPAGRQRLSARQWNRPAHLHLALSLGPHDGIDARLDDSTRVGLQRDLGFVTRLHVVELVLVIKRNDLELILHKGHDRLETEGSSELPGPQLQIDDGAISRRIEHGLTQLPLGVLELRLDLSNFSLVVAGGRPETSTYLRFRRDICTDL